MLGAMLRRIVIQSLRTALRAAGYVELFEEVLRRGKQLRPPAGDGFATCSSDSLMPRKRIASVTELAQAAEILVLA